jgi:hypothetical protein
VDHGLTAARSLRLVALAVLAATAAVSPAPAQERPREGLDLVPVIERGLESPVHLVAPPRDPRLFISEQRGRIRIVRNDSLLPRPFLDITDRVGYGGERGLLSVAFHPRYAANGRFFVNYTDRDGDTHVAEFRADPASGIADPTSERTLLLVEQPYSNHNGGHVLFGPDGALYVAMGDGGSAGDPRGRAQNPRHLLGKLLRLDVEAGAPRPETWALGLRNPWRIAFDSVTGLLFVADVGQNRWEEINVVRADSPGVNYGWRTMEGAHCFLNPLCSRTGLMPPVLEYGHEDGACSVTGGVVYRGPAIPALVGHYLYSDYCAGWVRSFRYAGGAAVDRREWAVRPLSGVTSFGTDSAGEAYVVTHSGTVYRIQQGAGSR